MGYIKLYYEYYPAVTEWGQWPMVWDDLASQAGRRVFGDAFTMLGSILGPYLWKS